MSAPAPQSPPLSVRFGPDGLVPAIIQHASAGAVLMLGYMNAEAVARTQAEREVTFWSRSRQRLWRKGESSGNVLRLVSMHVDCDADALLVLAEPAGPVCHVGTRTCWGDGPAAAVERLAFLPQLEHVLEQRIAAGGESSYTARLHAQGMRRMAQKVGEEGVEVALAAMQPGEDAALLDECADLLFHTMLLLKARGLDLGALVARLAARHASQSRNSSEAGSRRL